MGYVDDVIISNNLFDSVSGSPTSGNHPDAIQSEWDLGESYNVLIENNIFKN